jgi:DNA-binding transcriptional regulator YdaS (Cro superfamily)
LAGVIQSALQQVLGVIQARVNQLASSSVESGTEKADS